MRPGAIHHLTATRELVLPAVSPHAVHGLPVLAAQGYTGAGLHVPIRNPAGGQLLAADTRTRNGLSNGLRALAERGVALLKTRWRTLNKIILGPWRTGDITRACPVLTTSNAATELFQSGPAVAVPAESVGEDGRSFW